MTTLRQRTLVFCTAYTHGSAGWFYTWDVRYRTWVEAIRTSTLSYDQILLIDDGSVALPDWQDAVVLRSSDDNIRSDAPLVIYHFEDHLGRRATSDFPGWVRSFFFAARFAKANGIEKIIHLEADAFLISRRVQQYVNDIREGWVSFFCPRFSRPESGIQIIAGEAVDRFVEFARQPVEVFAGVVIETALPFTDVEHGFTGDRYGEYLDYVPFQAEWCMQAVPKGRMPLEAFFWWIPGKTRGGATGAEVGDLRKPLGSDLAHDGAWYTEFFRALDAFMKPRCYFEIGTNAGHSLRCFSCDAIGVDPHFVLEPDVIGRRRRLSLYQGTSDEFFASGDLPRLAPAGFDIAFLDGLHHAEVLLRDFINAERNSRSDSLIILHDCLPLNTRMAERTRRWDDAEDKATRDFWTGDVWKVVIALVRYRPDLRLWFVDCGPSGLVVCLNPNHASTVLSEKYHEIVGEFEKLELAAFGLRQLWTLCPTLDSKKLMSDVRNLQRAFGQRWLPPFRSRMLRNEFGGARPPILVHYGP